MVEYPVEVKLVCRDCGEEDTFTVTNDLDLLLVTELLQKASFVCDDCVGFDYRSLAVDED